MSKIQIDQLITASIEVLTTEETTQVVGGFFDGFNIKAVTLNQVNSNATIQNATSAFTWGNSNSNSTSQSNNANINLVY